MEFLLWSTGRAVLDLVHFADRKVEDGTMNKSKFIAPGNKRFKNWLLGVFKIEDSTTEHTPDAAENGIPSVYSGDSFNTAKDPEHLPPTNLWQRSGNYVRMVSNFLGSTESAFGFRVACATMSIAIVAYLKDTHTFFIEQRLVWAMIMVAIGMTTTAGSGVFGFCGRIAGTGRTDFDYSKRTNSYKSVVIAMCTSLVMWYIVNGKPHNKIRRFSCIKFGEIQAILQASSSSSLSSLSSNFTSW